MPHQVTNRRRCYARREPARAGFVLEAVNAIAYVLGGVCFVLASLCFLPALSAWYAVGVWLFLVGSVLYVAVTLHDLVENVHHRRLGECPRHAVVDLAVPVLYLAGSLIFVGASVFFLPGLDRVPLGAWGFIAGSALFLIGACLNVLQITEAVNLGLLQMLNVIAIGFAIGSVLFGVASVPYLWSGVAPDDRLLTYLAAQFTAGSALFLLAGAVNFQRVYVLHRLHNTASWTRGARAGR